MLTSYTLKYYETSSSLMSMQTAFQKLNETMFHNLVQSSFQYITTYVDYDK